MRILRIRPVDLSRISELPIDEAAMAGPMARALDALQDENCLKVLDFFAARYPMASDPGGILRSVMVKAIADRAMDAFYAELWARSIGFPRTVFVGATRWDHFLLSDNTDTRRVVGSVSQALEASASLISRVSRSRSSSRNVDLIETEPESHETDHDCLSTSSTSSSTPLTPESVLFILNFGNTYGGLYSYDHILSQDPVSALSPNNVVRMGRSGGPLNAEGIVTGFPQRGSSHRWARTFLALLIRSLARFHRDCPFALLLLMAQVCASVDGHRLWFLENFPQLRMAVFAYDLQVPPQLTLSLESLGIRTVAVNERPQSSVWELQPFAVSTLLTASEAFSNFARKSRSVWVGRTEAIGMWRTDLIHEYRLEPMHENWQTKDKRNRIKVLALPTHFSDDGWESQTIGTSVDSLRFFLGDLINLSRDRPDIHIVIRGKNCSWLTDPRFVDIATEIRSASAITVSNRYDRLNETYRLVASADVVLGKYTSLMDECLAMDIPSVIHDFTNNSRKLMAPIVPYLPDQIWAESYRELLTRFDFAVAGGGANFRQWWLPHRIDVYGDLNDGGVRKRAQAHMESLLLASYANSLE